MKQKYNVTGMSCSACSAHVEKAVSKVPGVNSVQVNLLQNSMVVDYDEVATNDQAIIHAVEEGGYGDADSWVAGMYHLSAACVDGYVVDTGTVSVEDQVSRFQIRKADLGSAVGLCLSLIHI